MPSVVVGLLYLLMGLIILSMIGSVDSFFREIESGLRKTGFEIVEVISKDSLSSSRDGADKYSVTFRSKIITTKSGKYEVPKEDFLKINIGDEGKLELKDYKYIKFIRENDENICIEEEFMKNNFSRFE